MIPGIISSLEDAGYRLVTVAECLGLEPYIWVQEPEERNVGPSSSSDVCASLIWFRIPGNALDEHELACPSFMTAMCSPAQSNRLSSTLTNFAFLA